MNLWIIKVNCEIYLRIINHLEWKMFVGSFNRETYLLFNVCYCLPCFYFVLYCDRSMGRVKNIEEQDALQVRPPEKTTWSIYNLLVRFMRFIIYSIVLFFLLLYSRKWFLFNLDFSKKQVEMMKAEGIVKISKAVSWIILIFF